MGSEELKEIIIQFMKDNPEETDENIYRVVRSARKQSVVEALPKYKPIEVDDRIELSDEFTEEFETIEFESLIDEATI